MATLARARRSEPAPARFVRIDGRPAQVVEAPSILPPRLPALLAVLEVIREVPLPRLGGFARACADNDHELRFWANGIAYGHELRLAKCMHCGAVEVRDISPNFLLAETGERAPTGGQRLRRRNHVLGWYSGRRTAGREYR